MKLNYVGDGEEELEEDEILAKNMSYIVCMMVFLIFTGIIIMLMLTVPKVPQNAHVPVLLWSLMILFSVAVDVESSVHPRLGLGWVILETFLIWVSDKKQHYVNLLIVKYRRLLNVYKSDSIQTILNDLFYFTFYHFGFKK